MAEFDMPSEHDVADASSDNVDCELSDLFIELDEHTIFIPGSLDDSELSDNTDAHWEIPGIDVASPKDEFSQEIEEIQFDETDNLHLSDLSEWIGEINPNFDEFDIESPYCNNCGSCAFAVYQRLEGNPDACATADNIGYNSQMTALTGMEQVSMTPEEIEARLLDAGNGAHAIIGIDRAEGPGHWFNAACIDGKVVAIDGQSGEVFPWPPDYGDVVNWEMSLRME